MANLERTMSCPPQLSSDDRGDEAQETSATDISPGSRPIRDQYLGHVIALDQSGAHSDFSSVLLTLLGSRDPEKSGGAHHLVLVTILKNALSHTH